MSKQQMFKRTPENAKALRGAFLQSPYTSGIARHGTDDDIFDAAERMVDGAVEMKSAAEEAQRRLSESFSFAARSFAEFGRALSA